MASSGRRRSGSARRLPLARYKPEEPHFRRVILPEILLLEKLEIPRAFIRDYGDDLLNSWTSVLLKIPNGQTWSVELEKQDERVFLVRGWMDFVRFFPIKENFLVVFGQRGRSMFHTVIYDEDGCEIEYPLFCSCPLQPDPDDHTPSSVKEEPALEMEESVVNISDGTDTDSEVDMSAEEDDDYLYYLSKIGEQAYEGDTAYSDALVSSLQFTSDYPFHRLILKPSYMLCGRAAIPITLLSSHVAEEKKFQVQLRIPGKVWFVMLMAYKDRNAAVFCRGWPKFLKENSLCVKDICVFECTAPEVFNVVIYRS